jgi:hypothetical protein
VPPAIQANPPTVPNVMGEMALLISIPYTGSSRLQEVIVESFLFSPPTSINASGINVKHYKATLTVTYLWVYEAS